MPSLQARALPVLLRVTRRRDSLGPVARGQKPGLVSAPSAKVRRRCSVTQTVVDGRTVWWFAPAGAATPGCVFFLHGGAYVNGFHPFHWELIADLVESTGLRVCAPDYPLAPAATVDDVLAWAVDRYREVAEEDGPLVVMGDSAGGGLAMAVTMQARDLGLRMPDRLVLLCPWLDVSMSGADAAVLDGIDPFLSREGLLACARAYAGDRDLVDPALSPLFGDLSGLPPTDLYAATLDQLWSDSRRLRWNAATEYPDWDLRYVEGPGMVHDWIVLSPLPEARQARRDVAERLRGG